MFIKNKTIIYTVRAKVDGQMTLLPNVNDIQLPDIEFGTDTIKGAGILGEIDWPSIYSPGSMTFSINNKMDMQITNSLIAPVLQEFDVRWTGDVFDTNNVRISVDSHKAIIKGLPKKLSPGKVEAGASQDGSNEIEVLYYKKVLNGVTTLEIDKLNHVFRVGDTDYGAQIREALGGI